MLEKIKEDPDARQIPVVVLSTFSSNLDIEAAYDRHANGYLVKPVDFMEMGEMLRVAGSYWLNWNQHPWD